MRAIHNTSFIVNEKFEDAWLSFMRTDYIPSIRRLGLCSDIVFTKVSIDQPDGKTYSLQLVFPSAVEMDSYLSSHMHNIDSALIGKFQGGYLCFNSVLTEI